MLQRRPGHKAVARCAARVVDNYGASCADPVTSTPKGRTPRMNDDTSTVLAQLRTVLDLTNTEIQVAETRVSQARTDAVRRELSQNAANGRARAEAIEAAIRKLGGFPDVIGP